MNVPHRLILRFLRMMRAYTGQSPPTLCPGACINVHHVRACSCRLSRRQPSHSRLAPVFTNSGRDCLVAFLAEQLEQAFIRHAIREISYIEFCHMDSFVLFGERAIENRLSGEGNAASINYMTFRCRTKLLTASLAPVPRQNAICGECL